MCGTHLADTAQCLMVAPLNPDEMKLKRAELRKRIRSSTNPEALFTAISGGRFLPRSRSARLRCDAE